MAKRKCSFCRKPLNECECPDDSLCDCGCIDCDGQCPENMANLAEENYSDADPGL
jgi:hypothetical protein